MRSTGVKRQVTPLDGVADALRNNPDHLRRWVDPAAALPGRFLAQAASARRTVVVSSRPATGEETR
jgi:hypothetical protein